MFAQELLRSQRKTVSRLDSRFAGSMMDPLSKYVDHDPLFGAIAAAFTATFLDYYHGVLKFRTDETYVPSNWAIGDKWKWTHRSMGSDVEQPMVNSGVDLAQALVQDPNLKVLVINGYYDLATPFSATEYMMTHLNLPPGFQSRIQLQYYEAGHMMYLHPPSARKLKNDLDAFIGATAKAQ